MGALLHTVMCCIGKGVGFSHMYVDEWSLFISHKTAAGISKHQSIQAPVPAVLLMGALKLTLARTPHLSTPTDEGVFTLSSQGL